MPQKPSRKLGGFFIVNFYKKLIKYIAKPTTLFYRRVGTDDASKELLEIVALFLLNIIFFVLTFRKQNLQFFVL